MGESSSLDESIAEYQGKIDVALAAQRASGGETIKVADLFRLTKAMPDSTDMSSVILELNAVATASGVDFISIAPQAPVGRAGGFLAVPIKLTFEGSYYDLTDFLFRLRNLVIVRDGELESAGRLFTLDALDLHEGSLGFPQVQASITVSAYAYAPAPAVAPPATTPPATTTPAAGEDPPRRWARDRRWRGGTQPASRRRRKPSRRRCFSSSCRCSWGSSRGRGRRCTSPSSPSRRRRRRRSRRPRRPRPCRAHRRPAPGLLSPAGSRTASRSPRPGVTSCCPSAASPPAIRSPRPAEPRCPLPGRVSSPMRPSSRSTASRKTSSTAQRSRLPIQSFAS